jgi:hypothetical protein
MKSYQMVLVSLALTLLPVNGYSITEYPAVSGHTEIDPNSDWEYITGYDPVEHQQFKDACLRPRTTARFQIKLCYSTARNGDRRIFFYSETNSITFPTNTGLGFRIPVRVDGQETRMNFFSTENHFGFYPDVDNGNSQQLISMLGTRFRNLQITVPTNESGMVTLSFSGLNQLNLQRLFP